MDDALRVQEGQSLQALQANGGDLLLVHPGVSHDVGQRPTFEIFHDDPELVSNQETVVHLHNIGMMVVAHDDNLFACQ